MESKKRICLIDEIRGLLIILVVIYHAFYSMVMIYDYDALRPAFSVMLKWQPLLPGMFILISGVSFQLSRSNVRRGLILLAVAAAISLVLWVALPQEMIWFGIIHFLAVANLALGLLKKYVDKIPAVAGIIICALLFAFTYCLQRGFLGIPGLFTLELPRWLYSTTLTAPLGFYSSGFHSADYSPIIPWIFLFIIGTILGRYARSLPASLCRTHLRPLAFVGRHTLIIYLVHQPVIVGVLQLISMIQAASVSA